MGMNTDPLGTVGAVADTRVRTLVVDNSPFMLKILAKILKEAGKFELIGTASNGSQALRYVSMLSPELVLMDLHMPRLNGLEAARYIKKREHPPIVIITTSDDNPVAKATAEEAGADGFVSKEGNLRQQMLDALQKLFGLGSAGQARAGCISFQNSEQNLKGKFVVTNENIPNQSTANKHSQARHFGVATTPSEASAVSEHRVCRTWGRRIHEVKRLARSGDGTQAKTGK